MQMDQRTRCLQNELTISLMFRLGALKQTNLQTSSFDGFEPIPRVAPRPPTTDLASAYDAALFGAEGWMLGGFG